MNQIKISKKEYDSLKEQSRAYKKVANNFFSALVKNSVKDVVSDFKKTGLYTKKFLNDLENGLKQSSYGK